MNQVPYHLCFDTLANELRIDIIRALTKKSMSVQEIVKTLGVEQSKVSHSLQMLRTCSYVNVEQKGKERIYSLIDELKKGISSRKNQDAGIFSFIDEHANSYCSEGCRKCGVFEKVKV